MFLRFLLEFDYSLYFPCRRPEVVIIAVSLKAVSRVGKTDPSDGRIIGSVKIDLKFCLWELALDIVT